MEAPAVSSAENVRRTGLCAGSDFTIAYRSCVFFLHSSGARITLEIYGELSERSKVRHSKCRVPKRNLGFESLTLRQKPSHIKAFAHMTGLFFSLKVTSAYMIFGKNSGVPAGLLQQPLQLLLPTIVRNVPLLLGVLHLVGGAKGSRSILTAYFSALWIIFSLAILIWAN